MSRVGKVPVTIPAGVEVNIDKNNLVSVKGPKGELQVQIHPNMTLTIADDQIKFKRKSDEKFDKALHGLSRSLTQNAVQGVTEGFEKQLEIIGVGYRAEASGGRNIKLSLGFSHPVEYEAPEGITIEMGGEKKNMIIVKGINKQYVGEVAAKIRSFRPPEPYKGKGIKYTTERIVRKAGKAAAK